MPGGRKVCADPGWSAETAAAGGDSDLAITPSVDCEAVSPEPDPGDSRVREDPMPERASIVGRVSLPLWPARGTGWPCARGGAGCPIGLLCAGSTAPFAGVDVPRIAS